MTENLVRVRFVSGYRWVGDPRLARFHFYVDGDNVGAASPHGGAVDVNLSPGPHTVRARFWWYLSPKVSLSLVAGESVQLFGDIPRELSIPRRMLRALLHPFNSLTLRVEDSVER
jgi:hypothetical protein